MSPYRIYETHLHEPFHAPFVELSANERTKGGVGPSESKRKKLREKRKSKNRG